MRRIVFRSALAMCLMALTGAALAADENGWSDVAELSFVTTAGNSESSTFGFKNTLKRTWDNALFTLRAGGIRVQTTSTTRIPVGTPTNFRVDEQDVDQTTAENYHLNGRYDRNVTKRFFWYAGAGWDRNRFAGIQNRYSGGGGVGNVWLNRDDMKFRTDYGLTYTDQENVVRIAGESDTFAGLRASWDYLNKLTDTTTYTNTLVIDENLDETSDFRADMVNALSVAMNSRLALKLSLQLLYDAEPSFELLELNDDMGAPTGTFVPVELDDLDTIFTASLVVNF